MTSRNVRNGYDGHGPVREAGTLPAMQANSGAAPRATIVMTARERHCLTEAAIESIVADTQRPYRLVYLDVQSPQWLRETLSARAAEWELEIVRFDEPLWPTEARARFAASIASDYAVFIDNDVQVEPGWLEALVECADATGAGVVGPLYLWGDGIGAPKIHMAGGQLLESPDGAGRVLDEAHRLFNADPRAVARHLVRQPCDFVEFHCMLIRTSLLRGGALFDPAIRCVHEHIDVALQSVRQGMPVYLEPAARVQYLAFSDHMLDDLPFFRSRWDRAEGEASIAAFARKWNVTNDDRSFGGVREFLRTHVGHVDPVRPARAAGVTGDRGVPLRADEFVQSRSALLDLALRRGYGPADIDLIVRAHALAQNLFDGGYRPCGRPFLNHAIGTAGVLVRYDFVAPVVAAGMLHAAYSHAPDRGDGPEAASAAVGAALADLGTAVERRVRAYTQRESLIDEYACDDEALTTLSVHEAEIIAIEAANEVDMHRSGEFRYTGRTDALPPEAMVQIAHVCRALGVDGLAATLAQAREREVPVPAALRTGMQVSYRFGPDRRTAVPMVGAAEATPVPDRAALMSGQ